MNPYNGAKVLLWGWQCPNVTLKVQGNKQPYLLSKELGLLWERCHFIPMSWAWS